MPINFANGVRVAVRQPVPPRFSVPVPSPARAVVVPMRGPAGADGAGGSGATGPTTDVHAVWHVDGGGVPIAADAGSYQLASNSPLLITITVGDDEAAVQATYDAALDGFAGVGDTFYTALVIGDWSDFTVEFSHRFLGQDTYLNVNALTLASSPVDPPTLTNIEPGHGVYEATPGLMADIIGRATPESPFTGTTGVFMDPTSEQYSDAGFVKWGWLHGSTRGVSDLMGGTIDRMDVQRRVLEDSLHREGDVNVQAYSDSAQPAEAVRLIMHAQIGTDGTGRDVHLRADDGDQTLGEAGYRSGRFELSITDPTVQGVFQAQIGQTDPLLDLQDDTGESVLTVTPSGEVHALGGVVLTSPDSTQYRLVVANDGTLSTEAV